MALFPLHFFGKQLLVTILQATSSHPDPLKRSIPFAQYLRLRRICSTVDYFNILANSLQKRLLERRYSHTLLKKVQKCSLTREQLLYKVPPSTQPVAVSPKKDQTRCILTYSGQHQSIRSILKKYWFLLTEDPILSQYVAAQPSITYRRSKSLKDSLVHSHFF